jgi:hypothetical protein
LTNGVPKTLAQALVDWMQEQDDLTYIILKDKDSKLIHIWKPSKCLLHEMEVQHLCKHVSAFTDAILLQPTPLDGCEVQEDFSDGALTDAELYIAGIHESLMLEGGDVLLAATWISDKEC